MNRDIVGKTWGIYHQRGYILEGYPSVNTDRVFNRDSTTKYRDLWIVWDIYIYIYSTHIGYRTNNNMLLVNGLVEA